VMPEFIYHALPLHVTFGTGTLDAVSDAVERLGITRALVLSTQPQGDAADLVAGLLGSAAVGVFTEATMHTPTTVTDQALAELERIGADGIVSIGGGSTIGLGKALVLRSGLKHLCIPTTYAGSEMTPILGQTENGRKTTIRDSKLLPDAVIYDVNLTLNLPVGMSSVSGMNAIAHAVEALYAENRNPVVDLMALEGISALSRALPMIVADPGDREARYDALYGAWLCGICLGSVGMALHHKLCHTLGGSLNLPHAETHAVLLPHAMRYNSSQTHEVMQRISHAIGAKDAALGMQNLCRQIGVPLALSDLGMTEVDINPMVDQALTNPYYNPVPLDREKLQSMLQRALNGLPA
jgi:maleylacetate reductase